MYQIMTKKNFARKFVLHFKQNRIQNKASREKKSMAEKPWNIPETCTKIFTLNKISRFCEMIEEDIFYCQKNSKGSHQKVTSLMNMTSDISI